MFRTMTPSLAVLRRGGGKESGPLAIRWASSEGMDVDMVRPCEQVSPCVVWRRRLRGSWPLSVSTGRLWGAASWSTLRCLAPGHGAHVRHVQAELSISATSHPQESNGISSGCMSAVGLCVHTKRLDSVNKCW